MEDLSIGAAIIEFALRQLSTFLGAIYGGVMGSFSGLAHTMTALYVAIVGYMVIMGKVGERTKDWTLSIFLVPMLAGIVFEPDLYAEWIVGPFRDTALMLSGFVAGNGDDVMPIIDKMDVAIGKILHAVDEIDVPGSILGETWLMGKVFVASCIIALVFIGLYLVFVVLYVQAFIGMYMMFLAGGIALFFAAFKETRFVTWTWLRQLMNYTLWAVFLGAIVGLGITGLEYASEEILAWDPVSKGVFTKSLGISLLWGCALIYVLLKAGDFSAALTGGTAPQAGGLIGTGAMVAGSAMLSGTRALHTAAGGWAGAAKAGMVVGRGMAGLGVRAWSAMRGFK